MKLLTLLECDIYRDGGSIQGVWLTDENEEWAVTLKIWGDWMNPHLPRQYRLFNCRINEWQEHKSIDEGSPQHKKIIELINDWMTKNSVSQEDLKNKIINDNRLYDLLIILKVGNC